MSNDFSLGTPPGGFFATRVGDGRVGQGVADLLEQIEAVLRKVGERQQEKRERDRMVKARVYERIPVEKDW